MITQAELSEVERGTRQTLAKRFSARWMDANARDLLGRAITEYAEWLEDNPPAKNPVAWVLNCVYWRALNLLDSETRKPPMASLDEAFHRADESTLTPEQQVCGAEERERLLGALGCLPDKERRGLTLVYFADMSIREAGRAIGWQKSATDRHHSAAIEKMGALVGNRGHWLLVS